MPARLRYVADVSLLAALYYGSARIGYELQFAGPVAAIVWLPAGVGVAYLYLRGLRFWPGVLVGDLLANDYSALPVASAIGQTLGNMVEVVGSTMLLRVLVRRGSPLDSVSGIGRMVVAITLGAAVSATVGALSILPSDVITRDELGRVWRTWWLGDCCGALIVVPLAIAWYGRLHTLRHRREAAEIALLLVATAALAEVAFRSGQPIVYIIFPALLWAAFRFGARGATLAVMVAVVLAIWNTRHDSGPFVYTSISRSVLSVQLFIAVAALSSLWVAAVVAERERAARGLAASRARLSKAVELERRRLERNLHDGAQQRLVALMMRVGEAKETAPKSVVPQLEAMQAELQDAIVELRQLAHGIHPAALTDFGLAAAVERIAAASPVPLTVVKLTSRRLDDVAEATAFYVISEGVTNAQRHAGATSIDVSAVVSGGTLEVDIVDDGVGGTMPSPGSGLDGLRARVEEAGGTLRIQSPAGQGTRLTASLPFLYRE